MPTSTADTTPSPWHAGEVALQQRVGVAERMDAFGRRLIHDFMPEQHRDFYRQLPFMLLGSVDAQGCPWASVLQGPPGFAQSPEPRLLQLNCWPAQGDPAAANLATGAAVGLLGIELHSRRRNRINGHVQSASADGFSVAVEQAFGNCPKYIQRRQVLSSQAPEQQQPQRLNGLDAAARALISRADTCFVTSYVDVDGDANRRAVDVSHRGGNAGFVQVDGDCLNIPDFAGNKHFNTLGNLLLNPRAGLLFINFNNGDIVQLSGRTEIVFAGPEVSAFQGAERLWRLHVEQLVRHRAALTLRWDVQQFSPHSLLTGCWPPVPALPTASSDGQNNLV
jgi:predicted pyridoxine 5'-phosphate oxidase superfamily flavin-nucleotide-binding protein